MTNPDAERAWPERNQMPTPPEPRVFEWSDTDVCAAIEDVGVAPWLGSPLAKGFARREELRATTVARGAEALPDVARDALQHLVRPDTVVALGIIVPAVRESHVAWYYGRDGDERLALHAVTPDGRHRVLYPVLAQSLLEVAHGALQLERPVDLPGVSVGVDESGLVALSLITDWMTERTTLAFLARNEPDENWRFDAEVVAALAPWADSADPRWMASRAAFVSPVPLSWTLATLERGLDDLTVGGLVSFDDGGYRVSDRLGALCGLMGACSGACAISTRTRRADGTWDRRHWAGMTGVATVWALEFGEIADAGFAVNIADVAPATAFDRMATLLHPHRVEAAREGASACRQCGHALAAGARFCDQCGAPVGTPDPTPRERPASCARCGAALRPGVRFCTQCGASIS
jgi:hypothetical protein